MVACPAIVKTSAGKEKVACKQNHAAVRSLQPFNPQMFHISPWPWESQEEELEDFMEVELLEGRSPNLRPNNSATTPALRPLCQTPVAKKVLYSLSSGHSRTCSVNSSSSSSSRSRQSPPSSSPSPAPSSASTIEKFTSLWDDAEDESGSTDLPPIDPSDYMKTLLCQLAASISSIKTAYAHQQTALNPYNVRAILGQEGSPGMALVSATDKAMVEELQRLSHLHSQLALLPHMLAFKEGALEVAVEARKNSMMQQLKCYEGIITRFHGEMRRKDAVAEALKETLAKSMLRGEKLQQRVKSLEAKLSTSGAT